MNSLNLLVAGLFTAVPVAAPPDPVISMNQDQLSTATGQTLALESVVSNQVSPAIAHLNVTSLDGTYVDLEDWTKDVTQPVPPGAETQLDWEVQAVNSGSFAIYVVLIPKNGPLVVSPPVHVTVAARQTLATGGALPTALAIPTLLGLAALATRIRPFRSRKS